MAKLITNPPVIRPYKPSEILKFTPAKLRKELAHICAIEPDTKGKIEAFVNFPLRWNRMSAYQYTQVALTWAVLEDTTNAQQLVITGTLDSFAYRAQLLGKVLE